MNTNDKLMEKIVQICDEAGVFYDSKDSVAFDNLVEKLLALISQERERLLGAIEQDFKVHIDPYEYKGSISGQEAKEQTMMMVRKALSDIGGGKQ